MMPPLSILTLMFFVSFDALGASKFHAQLPKFCRTEAIKSLPAIVQLFAADPNLTRSAGARMPAELRNLKYDFVRSIRLYDIDYTALASAETFEDVVISTNTWSVPMCLEAECRVIALIDCDVTAGKASVLYAGRDLQAKRFQESELRLANLGGRNTENSRIISSNTLDFIYIPASDTTAAFLIPASADLSESLFSQFGSEVFENGSAERIEFLPFRKLIHKRNEFYRSVTGNASAEDAYEPGQPDKVDGNAVSDTTDAPSKILQPAEADAAKKEDNFQATILDFDASGEISTGQEISAKDEKSKVNFHLHGFAAAIIVILAMLLIFRKIILSR